MVSNEKWFGASAGFYPATIDQSLRFDGSGDLRKSNFTTPTNNQQWTWSAWVKLGAIDSGLRVLFQADTNSVDVLQTNANKLNLGINGTTGNTTALYRDPSTWYHVLFNYNGSNAYLYVNNRLDLTLSPSGNSKINNSSYTHFIGQNGSNGRYWSGYMAELNFIDGQALDPSSFGETKNGVWIPKDVSGLTYGNNGFRLTFADSSNLGDDTSGNGNDYTSSGLASTDVCTDSPTNNFPTLNSIGNDSSVTFSEGNLKASVGSGDTKRCEGTFAVSSGKWYFEVNMLSFSSSSTAMIGLKDLSVSGHENDNFTNSSVYAYYSNTGNKYNSGNLGSYGATYTTGDIIGVALDLDAGTLTFYKNGSSQGTAFSSLSGEYTIHLGTGLNAWVGVVNFGQDGTFAGNETAQGNADANGIGDFYYAPPSGHLALCSSNLPDTTISPNQSTQADDHFDTIIYDGSASNQTITTNFQADWLWFKERTTTGIDHNLFDSSRGHSSSGAKFGRKLESNTSDAEADSTSIVSTSGNDITLLGGVSTVNDTSGRKYVMWHWRAGGSTPTKTYKVVVVSDSGNKYRFRNSADSATFAQSAVALDLQEGGTYVFDWSDSSAQGHPIRFSTTSDGTHGGGSEYTTGVVKDDSAYKTTITVASSAPTLYYYCQNHSGMGGQVNTNTTHGSTNFDGSILSVSQTNETSGFSIVLYTGTGSAGTIGHGLGVAPRMVITKVRNTANNWGVYHSGINDNTKALLLDTNGAATAYGGSTSLWNNTAPTSTVFSVGTNASTGGSGNFVAYVFAEIEGFSKFGSYTGNGQSGNNAPFIYTGFRPAWIMFKRTASSDSWIIHDNKRDPHNVATNNLFPNGSFAEDSNASNRATDFLSNGFKLRASAQFQNQNNETYIYMAFSDGQTAKFSNAR